MSSDVSGSPSEPSSLSQWAIVVTAEHASKTIPNKYQHLFVDKQMELESHRGFDHGALHLATRMAQGLEAPLYAGNISRLLVDLNRSPTNRAIFSEVTRRLSLQDKHLLLEQYYWPFRDRVKHAINQAIESQGRVLHLSVHSFAQFLHGNTRYADLSFLSDPARRLEDFLCKQWVRSLQRQWPLLHVRRNYPYRGTSDGHTTTLRTIYPAHTYVGIELELNQKHVSWDGLPWNLLARCIRKSLGDALTAMRAG